MIPDPSNTIFRNTKYAMIVVYSRDCMEAIPGLINCIEPGYNEKQNAYD